MIMALTDIVSKLWYFRTTEILRTNFFIFPYLSLLTCSFIFDVQGFDACVFCYHKTL